MITFFDIFENKYKNDTIIKKVNNDYVDLEYLIPFYSKFVENTLETGYSLDNLTQENLIKQKELGITPRATNLPNMKTAINYAIKYAETPNREKYHYFSSGDCANFVSQILEASRVKQTVYKKK